MKAIVVREHGDPSVLRYEDVESREPGSGEVRIRVRASGINFADILQIAGHYQVKPPFPFSPGLELAGEIVALGDDVPPRLALGDRVAAFCGHGGYAQEIVTGADGVFQLPDNMDFATAAGFLVAYGTSHVALEHRARLQPGEILLVHGAAGGVGLTAVELGKQLGATVIGTASTAAKLEIVASYGADHVINYKEESFVPAVKTATGGADVIFDPVGGSVFEDSLRCINWEGRLLVIGFASGRIPAAKANYLLLKNCAVMGVFWGAYAQRNPALLAQSLTQLLTWYAEGKLKPRVSHTFPLESAAEALQMLIERRSTGKVVLVND